VTKQTGVRRDVQPSPGLKLTRAGNSRGVKLKSSDPAPDAIIVNRNPKDNRVVASIELNHRPG